MAEVRYEEIQGKTEEERRDKEYEQTERGRQVIGLHRPRWVQI
jgi:DNA-binding PadR family transcriptional regulator